MIMHVFVTDGQTDRGIDGQMSFNVPRFRERRGTKSANKAIKKSHINNVSEVDDKSINQFLSIQQIMMADPPIVRLSELLAGKHFLTKEFFEKPEPVEVDPNELDFEYGKDKEKKEPEVDPNKGKVEAFSAIQNRVIGLYFSAGWCPPCRQFTPLLKALHEELEERKCPFQVVFVSFDKKEEDMERYYVEKHGDWLAVPFKDPLIE